uniref:Uncharacterized protein n=1 Tax=Chromera velia CCMP2878 TaxID=1169474 RepID=A0A0G4GWI4_9ALVE|eukprot:Cvel_23613.t1-p1 / transcript=Cvel_23613.t1 / gene=Cvel_23613 / organism=Chromera_velia_CCMP2878 / gene_product=hypothetical protein / transcript_product=hypothetical protein / location=Cvel_scaffold2452:13893-14135(+) / protein_length=81 / sequence_SO=supercontig / SO=protein_coding / is_pseudo=false
MDREGVFRDPNPAVVVSNSHNSNQGGGHKSFLLVVAVVTTLPQSPVSLGRLPPSSAPLMRREEGGDLSPVFGVDQGVAKGC